MSGTEAGKQPYMDFWYNNTWAAEAQSDGAAQYDSPLYGQYGEAAWDQGYGTYEGSDFHHNGDLQNYADPWEINATRPRRKRNSVESSVAKIYGTMDDLRLEHRRVQDKYIAMTEALIASTDVDGFRVDTPMQVPLPFYKRWAPAIRKYAQSVGKERFGIFGEFYVQIERYATMTGRGRDNSMYGQDRFLPGEATLKGGIVQLGPRGKGRLARGCGSANPRRRGLGGMVLCLGPPVVPFYRFFFGGGFPH
ncbi:unnamed protein product [Effrenium voratum]|uniref:Uncharacterized protein n=1 Tax=Effrenium voratum TaxID=2562239 RepID=A0AA36JAF4_9DINO|nr:unnamed protein product [Effrenium voratum]